MNSCIALLCNPIAENVRALRMTDEVSLHLKKAGQEHMIFTAQWPSDLSSFTQAWIVGGDGTLNQFINQYPDVLLPLALIPAGSANDFYWSLSGADEKVPQLVERLLLGRTVRVDGGICNGRLFLNGLGVGFDGAIVRDLLGKKKLAGKASYLLSVLKQILTYTDKPMRGYTAEERHEGDCLLLSVANGRRYGGDFMVAPNAVLDDGRLDISFVGRIAPLQRMRYLPLIEKGEHLDLPFVWYRQAGSVIIECTQELPAHLDGEFFTAARFEVRCLPARFCFFV